MTLRRQIWKHHWQNKFKAALRENIKIFKAFKCWTSSKLSFFAVFVVRSQESRKNFSKKFSRLDDYGSFSSVLMTSTTTPFNLLSHKDLTFNQFYLPKHSTPTFPFNFETFIFNGNFIKMQLKSFLGCSESSLGWKEKKKESLLTLDKKLPLIFACWNIRHWMKMANRLPRPLHRSFSCSTKANKKKLFVS